MTVHVEMAFPCEARALQMSVKHFQRNTQLPFGFPNGAVDYEADTQARGNVRSIASVGTLRSRQNVHTLQISKARNQCIGKPKALIIGNSPREKQWQHRE